MSKKYTIKKIPSDSTAREDYLHHWNSFKTQTQGRRSHLKSEGAQGGDFFSCNFLLLFWAIWKNDLFSKSQKVGGAQAPGPLCPPLYAAPAMKSYLE